MIPNDTERRLVRKMVKEGIPWVTIQRITGRSLDTIRSILNPPAATLPKGAAVKFGPKDVDKVLKIAAKMQKRADGQWIKSGQSAEGCHGILF